MPDQSSRLKFLIAKYASGYYTAEELSELMTLIGDDQYDADLDEAIGNIWDDTSADESLFGMQKTEIFAGIRSRIRPPQTSFSKRLICFAAAAILISAFLVFLKQDSLRHQSPMLGTVKVKPGSTKAVLRLADGSLIDLANSNKKAIPGQPGAKVLKYSSGAVRYVKNGGSDPLAPASYNSLTTPAGGQYMLQLSDGTKVWLNAATSIRFPVRFKRDERVVELSGEAYFEVAKDKNRPFRVLVNKSEVRVFGTHFNIMGYNDELTTNTTLLEGSVSVCKNGSSEMLRPGEQATVAESISVAAVNPEAAVQWQKGIFDFSHEKLGVIMRQIARWYDVDIVYRGKISTESFNGVIPRSRDLADVLNTLELTRSVHFSLAGRRLTVMP